ncbi:class I SAM-dependent methyltransferase [Bacillus salipaludis]|uniref:class I SAM-dependent methyltransferase n=1 Tax=Bacillus salipaludis TaxID=2547811 RepID=UPI002E1C46CE|nr:class I SAM-dependent methyltransferase [Bacillus salipaludis]
MRLKEIFTDIYKYNIWGGSESISGPGSSLIEAKSLIEKLPLLFNLFEINSILDAPCGDYNWMKNVSKPNITYLGVDIVDEIIETNNNKFANEQIRFLVKNIVEDSLPAADLVICRDCLVHLSNSEVKKAVENFKRSGSTYLLTTIFPNEIENVDINTGEWRPLNLCVSPFSFSEPILTIRETISYKAMALWKLSNLNI